MSRCGIRVVFRASDVRDLRLDSASVLYQDALAQALGSLVSNIIATRAGSMCFCDFYYPFKLAGLVSDDPTVKQRTMAEFEADLRAVWAAVDLSTESR